MGTVQRKIFSFPGNNLASVAIACAVPGPADTGGTAFAPNDGGGIMGDPNTADESSQRVDISHHGLTSGPVNAICIAPDSAIGSAWIALHGNNGEIARHLISPGNPLVGVSEADWALIQIQESLPSVTMQPYASLWDAKLVTDPDDALVQIGGWPLRLELWRGANVPLRANRRAPYVAHFCGQVLAADAPAFRYYYVCTDGRKRIDVTVSESSGAGCNVEIFECTAIKDFTGSNNVRDAVVENQLVLDDLGSTDVDVNGVQTFSFDGNSIPILKIRIAPLTPGEDEPVFQVRVRAEDP